MKYDSLIDLRYDLTTEAVKELNRPGPADDLAEHLADEMNIEVTEDLFEELTQYGVDNLTKENAPEYAVWLAAGIELQGAK